MGCWRVFWGGIWDGWRGEGETGMEMGGLGGREDVRGLDLDC